jgi:hypothetical protein
MAGGEPAALCCASMATRSKAGGARVVGLLLLVGNGGCARLTTGSGDVNDAVVTDAVDVALDAPQDLGARPDLTADRDIARDLDAGTSDVTRDDVVNVPVVWARQIAPLAGARVTQRRPTLRWTMPRDPLGVHVEFCADRACTRVEHTWTSAAQQARPPADLAPGVHFWRLTRGDFSSPSWPFLVPVRTGEADTSWNAITDLNGDGRTDVVVLTREGDSGTVITVRPHLGRPAGWPVAEGSFAISGDPAVRAVGDLDGDGYGELAVRRVCLVPGEDRIEIHRGGPAGPNPTPAHTLSWTGFTCVSGRRFVGVGDVNGDGFGDLVAESPRPGSGFTRRVEVYLGAPVGEALVPSTVLQGGNEYNGFGDPRALGDVNGDGFADVAIVMRAGFFSGGRILPARVLVYLGAPGGLPTSPSVNVLSADTNDVGFGDLLDVPFDGDGDGFADLAIGNGWFVLDPSHPSPRFVIHHGGRPGVSMTAETLWRSPYMGNLLGATARVPVDLDGDGRDEIAVFATQRGRVAVELLRTGASDVDAGTPTLVALEDRALRGPSSVQVGDLDGDARADLLVAVQRPGADAPAVEHSLVVLRGGVWPGDATPRVWLQGSASAAMTLAP